MRKREGWKQKNKCFQEHEFFNFPFCNTWAWHLRIETLIPVRQDGDALLIKAVPGWHRKFSCSEFTMFMSPSRFADSLITCHLRQGTRPVCLAFFSLPFTFYWWNQQKIWVHKKRKGIAEKTKVCSSALKPLFSSSQALDLSWHGDSLSLQFSTSLKGDWVAKLFSNLKLKQTNGYERQIHLRDCARNERSRCIITSR